MDEYAQEIQKKIDALPVAVREFIYGPEMAKTIQEIGAKHQLHVDQIGALEAEAAAVMIGVNEPDEFVSIVSDALEVDEQKSQAIVKDVNEKLFVRVRESMKASAEPKTEAPGVQMPSAVQSPPPAPTPTYAPAHAPTPMPVSTPTMVAPKPAAPAHDIMVAEKMLGERTTTATPVPAPAPAPVSVTPQNSTPAPKVEPPKPQSYKADPYREPVE